MKNYLAISALGPKHNQWFYPFFDLIVSCSCNVLSTRMSHFGEQTGILLHINGNWSAVAKLEALLPNLEKKLGLQILSKRTQDDKIDQYLVYQAHAVSIDRAGILSHIVDFFAQQGMHVADINACTHQSVSGTQLVTMNIQVHILPDMHISSIREQFLHFCDNLNIDASFELVREY